MRRPIIPLGLLLFGLPLLGVWLAGHPVPLYLEFPPRTRAVPHAPFSWSIFLALGCFVLVTLGLVLVRLLSGKTPDGLQRTGKPFPWWGWVGLGWLGVAWALAWSRVPWFAAWQPFTFTPLWLGYIVIINALVFMRTGTSMLTHRWRQFLALFPLSAAFWWFFEYLNRFVQNWFYQGIQEFSAVEYIVHATISFSTVLPAVIGTIDWLCSFPRLQHAFRGLWTVKVGYPRLMAWIGVLAAAGGLSGIGVWPEHLFPLLWLGPLVVIVSVQTLYGQETVFSRLSRGDWTLVCVPALAGLVCGFWWELWNVNSAAHWEYTVPYVHRFLMFEMPLLGYAGYLPFGIECKLVADLLPDGVRSGDRAR